MIIFVLSEFMEGFFITNQNKNLHPLKVKIKRFWGVPDKE